MSNDLIECSKIAIEAAPDVCAYATLACFEKTGYFNFTTFYYCQINQNIPIMILLSLFFIFIVFNFIAKVADSYLAPSLQVLSEKLKLSEAVAGATLLSLGNSAPEVITGIVVGGKASGSMELATGGLIGGCFFTITIILAACIRSAGDIKVDVHAFKRDILFLIVGVLYFIFLTIIDKVTPVLACGYFVLYVVYVAYVFIHQKFQKRRKSIRKELPTAPYADLTESLYRFPDSDSIADLDYEKSAGSACPGSLDDIPSDTTPVTMPEDQEEDIFRGEKPMNSSFNEVADTTDYIRHEEKETKNMPNIKDPNVIRLSIKLKEEWKEGKNLHPRVDKEDNHHFSVGSFVDNDGKKSFSTRLLSILAMPVAFLGAITIPPFEVPKWNVYKAVIVPYFSLLFMIWQFRLVDTFLSNPYLWIIYSVIATGLAVLLYVKGKRENLAKTNGGILSLAAFLISSLWLNLITNLIVEYLTMLRVITDIPLGLISLTVLAWGTSLEDLFINIVISKSGLGRMAVIGVYGSQIFGIFIGFGAALLRQSLQRTVSFGLYDFDQDDTRPGILTIILLVMTLSTLGISLAVGKSGNWMLKKKMMVFLGTAYSLFIVACIVISLV